MREAEGQSTTPAKLRAQQKKPEAYVFALPEEHRFDYVNRTLRALHLMSYPFRVLPGATQETPRPKGMRLSLRPHQLGAFLVHVGTWSARKVGHVPGPVMTVESDTFPIRSWDLDPSLWLEYDAVLLHGHPATHHKGCANTQRPKVVPAYGNRTRDSARTPYTFATGAVLWTARTKMREAIYADPRCATGPERAIEMPIDTWLSCANRNGLLRVGQACPYYFRQGLRHCSKHIVGGEQPDGSAKPDDSELAKELDCGHATASA